MRRPHISIGAWLFCAIVTAALIMPAGVYAAVNSHVAIGNVGDATTAAVDDEHQLLTTMVGPRSIVRFRGNTKGPGCQTLYTPPAGKALMLTNVTFDIGSGHAGQDSYAFLLDRGCKKVFDVADTAQVIESQQHTYPTGLPVDSVTVAGPDNTALIIADGYLIPSAQLPATAISVGKLQMHRSGRP
jgi:hypothetical protein